MSTTQKRQRVPAANPTQSFWNATSKPLDEFRSSEELLPTADVVIIGSGLSGVATAYYLLNGSNGPQQQQPSIILLEARTTCSGATGRNGGHCKPDTYSDVPKFARLFGLKEAAQLAEFEAENVRALKSLVEEEDIDCDFHLTRATDVFLDPSHAQEVRDTYAKLSKLGIMNLADVAFTQEKDVERITGVKGAKGSLSYTAAHLWPSKLVQHLLLKLIDQGLNLQTRTSVSSVGPSGQESRPWSVNTCRGSIKTRKVIHATNAYASYALPEYAHAITPVRGVCSHLASPKQAQTPHLVNTYGLRFNKVDNDYLVPRADGSIIVGGARQLFWHKKEQWFDVTSDDELIKEASSYFDGYMQRHFRGWTDSGMETRKVWTGILGYSFDFMPHVGEVPGKQGQYIIAGFTGYGMPKILLCSKGVAGMVLNNSDYEATNLPRVFKTTRERNESTTSPLKESLKAVWDSEPKL